MAEAGRERAVRVFVLVGVCLYREGLVDSFDHHRSVSVVGSTPDSGEAMSALEELKPDVVLLDSGLPDGLAVARKIRETDPGVRIVALAVSEMGPELFSWIESGISGYVTPNGTVGDLVDIIGRAARGEVLCSPAVVARLFDRLADLAVDEYRIPPEVARRLTRREAEIARLVGQGLSNKEIAKSLSIALPTVKNHVHNVLRKLEVSGRADVTAVEGWLRGRA